MNHHSFRWIFCFLILGEIISAHIGLRYTIFEQKNRNIPFIVYLKAPKSAPGFVDISFKLLEKNSDRISVYIAKKNSVNISFEKSSVIAIPVNGEEKTYSAKIMLDEYGTYIINAEIEKNGLIEISAIPINFFATNVTSLEGKNIFIFSILTIIFLILSILILINAFTYNKKYKFKKDRKSNFKLRPYYALDIFFFILLFAYVGKNWLNERSINMGQQNFFGLKNNVKIVDNGTNNIIEIEIVDKLWIDNKISDLIPDHGKIMHLYMISDDFEYLAHLHPVRLKNKNIFYAIMPTLNENVYSLYMDITHQTGFSHTMTNSINYIRKKIPRDVTIANPIRDPDDSWTEAGGDIKVTWENKQIIYEPEKDIPMKFKISKDGQPLEIETYMGMAAHAALLKADKSIFAHLHPTGTINMTSRKIFEEKINDRSKKNKIDLANHKNAHISYYYSKKGEVNFPPLRLINEGDYWIWIQIKNNGQVLTEKFKFKVG